MFRDPVALVGVFIPIIMFMIPIVAILTAHQRKMAEIMHRNQPSLPNPETDMLRAEVRELRERINQQTIAIDNLLALQKSSGSRATQEDESIRSALNNP